MQKSRIQDLVIGLIAIAIGVFLLLNSLKFPDTTKQFTWFVLFVFIGLGLVLVITSLINAKKPGGQEVDAKTFKNPLIMFLLVLLYVIMLDKIGFFVASVIFMPVTMLYMGYRKPLPIIFVTGGMLAFVWLLFVFELKVRLPQGLLF